MIGPPMVPPNCCHLSRRNEFPGNRIRRILSERIARRSCIGSSEPETFAVKIIAARLGLNGDNAAQCLAELGVIVLQIDLGFLNRIKVRIDHDNPEDRILVVGAIEFKCGAAEMLAVHENLLAALRILRGGVAPAHHLLRAGGQELEGREVAVHDRQVFDVFLVELDGDVGAVRLQLGGFRGDFDLFTGRANLELAVDVRRRVGGNAMSLNSMTLKPGASIRTV